MDSALNVLRFGLSCEDEPSTQNVTKGYGADEYAGPVSSAERGYLERLPPTISHHNACFVASRSDQALIPVGTAEPCSSANEDLPHVALRYIKSMCLPTRFPSVIVRKERSSNKANIMRIPDERK